MRQPLVLVYESDGRIAAHLRGVAEERKHRKEPRWTLHEPRHPEACLRLLRPAGRSVLVLKLGSIPRRDVRLLDPGQAEAAARTERALVRELTLLERVTWLCPEAATVVVGDADHAELAALYWDLGAAYVSLPPRPREGLPEIVAGLLGLSGGRPDCPSSPATTHD
jgi:hypothetical protein